MNEQGRGTNRLTHGRRSCTRSTEVGIVHCFGMLSWEKNPRVWGPISFRKYFMHLVQYLIKF
ncbi:hypothetical protein HOLleu_34239 [Holothuria leucospilota]|uniref:Uncharacterized protein n=1 Tax=Holothuria leucospilota TaxID=206669 RepID=A0A9Q0YN37_HOLLE|nr:hypothetical protein HOLleu_34239 [Holothuria leucospilota]